MKYTWLSFHIADVYRVKRSRIKKNQYWGKWKERNTLIIVFYCTINLFSYHWNNIAVIFHTWYEKLTLILNVLNTNIYQQEREKEKEKKKQKRKIFFCNLCKIYFLIVSFYRTTVNKACKKETMNRVKRNIAWKGDSGVLVFKENYLERKKRKTRSIKGESMLWKFRRGANWQRRYSFWIRILFASLS